MKPWVAVAGLVGLAASAASGALVKFNQNLLSANPGPITRFSFASDESVPLRQSMLMADNAYPVDESLKCAEQEVRDAAQEVTVLIALSKCLNESSLQLIHDWVQEMQGQELTYFDEGLAHELHFATAVIPGDCEARTVREEKGLETNPNWDNQEGYQGEGGAQTPEGEGEGEGDQTQTQQQAPPPMNSLLSNEVLPADVARISMFAKFGRVLDALPTEHEDIPIAVVSFVNNELSYDEVEQYERKSKISAAFNFQICDHGRSCEGRFENCIKLLEDVDLFMYNPFTITRSFECDSILAGGVPVSYLDNDNKRACLCACPAGYGMTEDNYGNRACEQVEDPPCPCTWNTATSGYSIVNTENLRTCHFCRIASDWGVPVPFPVDNYVADGRINRDDGKSTLAEGPHVDLSTASINSRGYTQVDIDHLYSTTSGGVIASDQYPHNYEEMLTMLRAMGADMSTVDSGEMRPYRVPTSPLGPKSVQHFTWKNFQDTRVSKIDDLSFTSYGKYQLEVVANDYSDSATCTGCMTIVDGFRPRHTTQCGRSFCDNTTSLCDGYDGSTAELTLANRRQADQAMESVWDFRDKATNDECSEDRCDYKLFRVKDFFENRYCAERPWREVKQCFNKRNMENAFVANPKSRLNPLVETDHYGNVVVKDDDVPVRDGKCTRCCSAETELREFWTDYKCCRNYDVRLCSGDAEERCEVKQCLTMFGDTLAEASACIKDEVVAESERVLSGLVQEGFQTHTQVHRGIPCTDLNAADPKCSFKARMTDLLDIEAQAKILERSLPANEYVFWRYRIEQESWNLFTENDAASMEEHVFATEKTKITLEAWSQCGLVRRFFFYVHLHVHSDILVCDYFDEMWYQTSVNRLPITSDICAYPGSDFAEVTFDYRPNAGLQYDKNKLRLDVVGVSCSAAVSGRSEVNILTNTETNPEIIERYAVELLRRRRTNHTTSVNMTCTFTYSHHDATPLTKSCWREITMRDCTPPKFDDNNGECLHECANRNRPGPFEACGGQVISHTNSATQFRSGDVPCCRRCTRSAPVCTAILGLSNEDEDIKRCVPELSDYNDYTGGAGGAYDEGDNYDLDYANISQEEGIEMLAAAARNLTTKDATSVALLGVSAMVAVVALVVVRRRRASAAAATEDAYYPLLH